MPEITPEGLKSEWQAKKFRPAYLLYGEERFLKEKALRELKDSFEGGAFNLEEVRFDPSDRIAELLSLAQSPPVFSAARLILLREASSLKAAARKALAEYLETPLETTCLVLVWPERKLDLRDPVAAACMAHGAVAGFKPLKEWQASDWVRRRASEAGLKFQPEALDWLLHETGTDLAILDQEVEKLILLARGAREITVEDVRASLGYRREENPFDFPRALQSRDRSKAMGLAEGLMRSGAEPLSLVYQTGLALAKQLRAKRMLKGGASREAVFRELRLQPYYDRDFLNHLEGASEPELRERLLKCLECEVDLKSKAWLSPRAEVRRLVLRICR